MILQSLYQLYLRRMADPDPEKRLPAFGFQDMALPYIVVIDRDGQLVELKCTLSEGKKPVAKTYLVPQAVKKTSGVAANLFWDTLEYALGVDTRGKPERVVEQHAAFRARIAALPSSAQEDEGILALKRFLDNFTVEQIQHFARWPEVLENNPNLSFKLDTDSGLICQRPAVMQACIPQASDNDKLVMCLVTGEQQPLQELHTAIKGVWGAQTAGANIVSFNADAYCSFGKNGQQGANAPVGQAAAFGYTTALNDLLKSGSRQRAQVGDTSTVFWAEQAEADAAAEDFAAIFSEPPKDNPRNGTDAVERLYNWVRDGKAVALTGDTAFYVLGLAPNAARLSVRFWKRLPLRDLAERTLAHFDDLAINKPDWEQPYYSLFRLLAACAAQGKADNIPPTLAGDVMRAVLEHTCYPATLYQAALNRCRIEHEVTPIRAAILKACLLRQWRIQDSLTLKKDCLVMLDAPLPEEKEPAYHMGRLFAALERLQALAINDANATIRDRWFGAALSSPATVFNSLLRLHAHHLAKLRKSNKGAEVVLDKLIGEIMLRLDRFPLQLTPQEQGLFCIGYYHQRQAFYAKKADEAPGVEMPAAAALENADASALTH